MDRNRSAMTPVDRQEVSSTRINPNEMEMETIDMSSVKDEQPSTPYPPIEEKTCSVDYECRDPNNIHEQVKVSFVRRDMLETLNGCFWTSSSDFSQHTRGYLPRRSLPPVPS